MADLIKISTGMAQGPEAINADLNAINAELEGGKRRPQMDRLD